MVREDGTLGEEVVLLQEEEVLEITGNMGTVIMLVVMEPSILFQLVEQPRGAVHLVDMVALKEMMPVRLQVDLPVAVVVVVRLE